MPKFGEKGVGEMGTRFTEPVKGPARSTSGEWVEPDTHPQGEDKPDGTGGVVDNVGKTAGQIGKKGGRTKVW
jgi:hypothetical protein